MPRGQNQDSTSGLFPIDAEAPAPFASNDVRLSAPQWVVVALIVTLVFIGAPRVWKRVEPLEMTPDYRMPYALSDDYWLYGRVVENRSQADKVLVIGDSVMWGEYVRPNETFSHFLNEQDGSERFANCGVNGTHPLALEGLVRYYAGRAAGGSVLLHCNLLWMSSEEQDLQTDKEVSFNHPFLAPQFSPRLPAYHADAAVRLGIVVDRATPFRGWVRHLRVAYFENQDLQSWSLEHPYSNPFQTITLSLPPPSSQLRHSAEPWSERGIQVQDFPWVDLDSSLQWGAFRRTAELIRRRRGRLFVIVGPLNAHMLDEPSRERHRRLKSQVEAWLTEAGIPFYSPRLLPSDLYGDASHPLAAGYSQLAKEVFANEAFRRLFGKG